MDYLAILKKERAKAKASFAMSENILDAPLIQTQSASSSHCVAQQEEISIEAKLKSEINLIELVKDSVYYAKDVIETDIADQIEDMIKTQSASSIFTQLSSRLVTMYGINPNSDRNQLEDSTPPSWLSSLARELTRNGIFSLDQTPNNFLINHYPASGGILHHTDGPSYSPKVAILSLGGPVKLSFRPRLKPAEVGGVPAGDVCSLLAMPHSLIVFRDAYYSDMLHGIETDKSDEVVDSITLNRELLGLELGVTVDRGSRISLTFRHV